jgi:hypothetical protein
MRPPNARTRHKAMLEDIWPGQIAGHHFVDWCR